jgi:hypothetical protein
VRTARVVRIADTLSLAEMDVSEALWSESGARSGLSMITPPHDFEFGPDGNLR